MNIKKSIIFILGAILISLGITYVIQDFVNLYQSELLLIEGIVLVVVYQIHRFLSGSNRSNTINRYRYERFGVTEEDRRNFVKNECEENLKSFSGVFTQVGLLGLLLVIAGIILLPK